MSYQCLRLRWVSLLGVRIHMQNLPQEDVSVTSENLLLSSCTAHKQNTATNVIRALQYTA